LTVTAGRLIVVALLLLTACSSSPAPQAQPAFSPSVADLVNVAAQIYPSEGGRYVTCDSGFSGSTRYSHCPVTARLNDRLLTVFSGSISAPEPLGGGQDPEWPMESISSDLSGTGGVAHVELAKPGSPSSRYDLVIHRTQGKLLVDDIYCTKADPSTSSIYQTGWMNRSGC